jgi:hypothetical protein
MIDCKQLKVDIKLMDSDLDVYTIDMIDIDKIRYKAQNGFRYELPIYMFLKARNRHNAILLSKLEGLIYD